VTVAFYTDHHVHAAVTEGLRRRSVDVLTVAEDGYETADDAAVLARATALNRAVYSQDRHLLVLARRWSRTGRDFSGVVYAHQLDIDIGTAVRDLELIAKVLDPSDLRNTVIFLPLTE
jgi:hypothetical protein